MPKPIERPTLEEFLRHCHERCVFLVSEYCFELLPEPREYNEFSVRYRKGEFEVHVYGENYGENASCDLVRGTDRLPLGFMMPVEERKPPKLRRVIRGQLAQIDDIADRLERHASEFLRGDIQRFDAALAEFKELTKPGPPITEERRQERAREHAIATAGHAAKRGDHAEVVRLLDPHAAHLSPRQRQLLETARARLGKA